jgi:hypothetical protein
MNCQGCFLYSLRLGQEPVSARGVRWWQLFSRVSVSSKVARVSDRGDRRDSGVIFINSQCIYPINYLGISLVQNMEILYILNILMKIHLMQNKFLFIKWLSKILKEDGVWPMLLQNKHLDTKSLSQVYIKSIDSSI